MGKRRGRGSQEWWGTSSDPSPLTAFLIKVLTGGTGDSMSTVSDFELGTARAAEEDTKMHRLLRSSVQMWHLQALQNIMFAEQALGKSLQPVSATTMQR